MSDGFDSTLPDELLDRLAALGHEPVPPAVQSQHLTAMASVHPRSAWSRLARRAGIVAAFGAGLVVGTTGLATAGALGPLQPIVAKGVEAATPLNVPKGPSEKADHGSKTSPDGVHGTARVTDGCVKADNGEYAINHGQYLKQERAKGEEALAAAKLTDCGKPLAADDDDDADEAKTATNAKKPAANSNANKGGVADDHKVARCDDDDDATTDDPKAADNANDAGKSADAGKPACTPAKPAADNADDAGKSDDPGKSGDAGRPDDAGKPETTGKPADPGAESDK